MFRKRILLMLSNLLLLLGVASAKKIFPESEMSVRENFVNHFYNTSPNQILNKDTVIKKRKILNSTKAVFYSMTFPGAGQIYNKKYWKVPIVYIGFGALFAAVSFNNHYYNSFIYEYNVRSDNNPQTTGDPKYDGIKDLNRFLDAAAFYKRYRDLSLIGVVAFYAFQIVDAYVDSELSAYDISDNLAFKIDPHCGYLGYGSNIARNYYFGLTLKLNMK